MIDFNDMKRRQEEGLKLVDSLQEDERDILRHYCSLSTEALVNMGAQKGSSIDQVIINALKTGIALGLRLQVVSGEVQGRP